jgi:hypothetical protein
MDLFSEFKINGKKEKRLSVYYSRTKRFLGRKTEIEINDSSQETLRSFSKK